MAENRHRNVLVLAPHPDDETFGCGGTIRMLTDGGVSVDVAFLTRGEQGLEEGLAATAETRRLMAEIRTCEAQAACGILGVKNVYFLNGHDTQLSDEPQLARSIAQLLDQGDYQRVFCPWPQDSHDDHRAAFTLLQRAVVQSRTSASFWLYEIWKPLPANTFVPIDRTWEIKRQAIEQYRSQLEQLNYREGFLGLAAYRSLFCPSSRYAEAFLVCDARELHQLS